MGSDRNLVQIAKLLKLAEDQPGTPEGETARKIADKRLARLGLTAADVEVRRITVLKKSWPLWEAALLYGITCYIPCDLINHVSKKGADPELVIRGPMNTLDRVQALFTSLRRAILIEGAEYIGPIRFLVTEPWQHISLRDSFYEYAVTGLAERLIADEEEESRENPEESSPENIASDVDLGLDEEGDEPELDPMDKLLDKLNKPDDPGDSFPELDGLLDPCVAGYEAGLNIPLVAGITSSEDLDQAELTGAPRRTLIEQRPEPSEKPATSRKMAPRQSVSEEKLRKQKDTELDHMRRIRRGYR